MNYETYINLILSGNPHDANRYKAAFIPNRLYKYYSLGDDPALNELKLETLSRGDTYPKWKSLMILSRGRLSISINLCLKKRDGVVLS